MLNTLVKCPRCGYRLQQSSEFTNKIKKEYPNAFLPWKAKEDIQLRELVEKGADMLTIAEAIGRQPTAIKRRIELMGFKPLPKSKSDSITTWEAKEQEDLKRLEKTDARPSNGGAVSNAATK